VQQGANTRSEEQGDPNRPIRLVRQATGQTEADEKQEGARCVKRLTDDKILGRVSMGGDGRTIGIGCLYVVDFFLALCIQSGTSHHMHVVRQGETTRTNDKSEVFIHIPDGTPAGASIEVVLKPSIGKAVTVRAIVPLVKNDRPARIIGLPLAQTLPPDTVFAVKRISVVSAESATTSEKNDRKKTRTASRATARSVSPSARDELDELLSLLGGPTSIAPSLQSENGKRAPDTMPGQTSGTNEPEAARTTAAAPGADSTAERVTVDESTMAEAAAQRRIDEAARRRREEEARMERVRQAEEKQRAQQAERKRQEAYERAAPERLRRAVDLMARRIETPQGSAGAPVPYDDVDLTPAQLDRRFRDRVKDVPQHVIDAYIRELHAGRLYSATTLQRIDSILKLPAEAPAPAPQTWAYFERRKRKRRRRRVVGPDASKGLATDESELESDED
jgi:hypothetical protein